MRKILTLVVLVVAFRMARADGTGQLLQESSKDSGRHKRLLFYDEDGSLVKTYSNPYLRDLAFHPDKWPFYGNFINPFFSFLRASSLTGSLAFTIPVSSEVVQRIQIDPIFQHKLFYVPKKNLTVKQNSLCEGIRAQIPSPELCNNFINCWDGWAFEQECPEGLLFSNEGFCDYSDNVDCKNRFITDKPKQPSSQPQEQSSLRPPNPQPNPIPQLPIQAPETAPQPCSKPQNDPQSQTHPQTQPQVEPQSPPQIPLVPEAYCNHDFESFRNKFNCNEFFVCVNRQPVKFKCPADLAYSQELGVCDYSERVDCGGSPLLSIIPPPPALSELPPIPNIPGYVAPAPPKPSEVISVTMKNSTYSSQNWSSTHIAMSRQDAIRQIQAS